MKVHSLFCCCFQRQKIACHTGAIKIFRYRTVLLWHAFDVFAGKKQRRTVFFIQYAANMQQRTAFLNSLLMKSAPPVPCRRRLLSAYAMLLIYSVSSLTPTAHPLSVSWAASRGALVLCVIDWADLSGFFALCHFWAVKLPEEVFAIFLRMRQLLKLPHSARQCQWVLLCDRSCRGQGRH